MSVAALVRELVMQGGGVTQADLQHRLPDYNRRTIARVLQAYSAAGFITEVDQVYYPPSMWPTAYFVDQTLVRVGDAEGRWVAIDALSYHVPCAAPILLGALTALEVLAVVEIDDTRKAVRLLDIGSNRVASAKQERAVMRHWMPPREVNEK